MHPSILRSVPATWSMREKPGSGRKASENSFRQKMPFRASPVMIIKAFIVAISSAWFNVSRSINGAIRSEKSSIFPAPVRRLSNNGTVQLLRYE